MTLGEYQKAAARTINPMLVRPEAHALYGLASEVGELLGIYQKALQGHTDTEEHRQKEVGDILWMVAEYCTSQGWDMDMVAEMNISKLQARYPDGFEVDKSIHRNTGDV